MSPRSRGQDLAEPKKIYQRPVKKMQRILQDSLEQIVPAVLRQGRKLDTGGSSADIYTGWFRGGNYLIKVLKERYDRLGQNQDVVYRSIHERVPSRYRRFFPQYYGSTRLPDERLVLVMDHMPGSTDLFEFFIGKRSWLTLGQRLGIGRQLIEGVRCLHEHGIVHGDLKPENVIIDPATLKIRFIDFGVSGPIQGSDYVLTGTPIYYPPENQNDHYKRVSGIVYRQYDLWVLGLVLLCVLGGKDAFIRVVKQKNLDGLDRMDALLRESFPEYPDLRLLIDAPRRRIVLDDLALRDSIEQINRAFQKNQKSGLEALQMHPEVMGRVQRVADKWQEKKPWKDISTSDKYWFFVHTRQEERLEKAMRRIDGMFARGDLAAVETELEKEPSILSRISYLYWDYSDQAHDQEWDDLSPARKYAYFRKL
jgi:serine/threonine protein kinase